MKTFLVITYPFLFLIIPMLQLWYKNYAEVYFALINKLLCFYILLYTILYSTCNYIFEYNYLKMSFVIAVSIYVFNNIYTYYRKMKCGRHLSTRIINGILLGLVSVSPLVALHLPINITNVLSKILLIFSTLVTSVYIFGILSLDISNSEKPGKINVDKDIVITDKKLPNIYYIIPDSYMGNTSLKKYYDFDNKEFIDWLGEHHFQVNKNAKSNYPITNVSLSSTLNMDYLENYFEYDEESDYIKNLIRHEQPHFNHKVARLLKANGYKYYHLLNYWEKQMHTSNDIADVSYFSGNDIADFINFLYAKSLIRNIVQYLYDKNLKEALLGTFEKLEELAVEKSDQPKFVLAHMICPHHPFLFDRNGNRPSKKLDKHNYEDFKKLYIEQLQYLNIRLKKIITKIQENDSDAIILIQGDHGGRSLVIKGSDEWHSPSTEFIEERFCILRAIYAKDIDLDCISSVNVFRCILNSVLGTNYEMLPDKYMFSNYDNRLKTYDVSDKVNIKEKDEVLC